MWIFYSLLMDIYKLKYLIDYIIILICYIGKFVNNYV